MGSTRSVRCSFSPTPSWIATGRSPSNICSGSTESSASSPAPAWCWRPRSCARSSCARRITMIGEISPGLILIIGALFVPLLRGRAPSAFMLLLPVAAFVYLIGLPHGGVGQVQFLRLQIVTLRVDKLSLLFGYIFLLATFLGVIYALHVGDTMQHVATLIYAGSAVGAVFAGDLV